jgi:hypothetical protein
MSVIVDDLPGFDKKAAASLCEFIAANGYSVARLTVDELLSLEIRRSVSASC